MGLTGDKRNVSKRKTVIFFVLDASGSMTYPEGNGPGTKIEGLNSAMKDAINIAKEIETKNSDNRFEVAILIMGTGANGSECIWKTKEPIPVTKFSYEDISADGWTPMAAAINELNDKASRNKFLDSPSASGLPIFIFMTDGIPCVKCSTEEKNYADTREAIQKIHKNSWFEHGFKAAIAIGDTADKKILAEFTGSDKTVFETHNTDALREVIKFVIASSTLIGNTILLEKKENAAEEEQEVSAQGRLEDDSEKFKKKHEDDDEFNSVNWKKKIEDDDDDDD